MSATPSNPGFLRRNFLPVALGVGGAAAVITGIAPTLGFIAAGTGAAVVAAPELRRAWNSSAMQGIRRAPGRALNAAYETIVPDEENRAIINDASSDIWKTLTTAKAADGSRVPSKKHTAGNLFLTAAFAPVAVPVLLAKAIFKTHRQRQAAAAAEGPSLATTDGPETPTPAADAGPTMTPATPGTGGPV